MLAISNRTERMANSGPRYAGRFHDDFDLRIGDEQLSVIGDERRTLLVRLGKRTCSVRFTRPTRSRELAACARDVEISNTDYVNATGKPRLRKKHRAELPGPYHRNCDGPASGLTLK